MGRQIRPLGAAPKLWNFLKYRSLKRETRTSTRRYTPQIASVMLTKRCNLACDYCSAGNLINQPGAAWRANEATLERIQQIFSNPLFGNCLLVDLLGGEPLLVKELEPIVSYLAHRGHIVNMATNGVSLLSRIAGLKRAGISRINVSLYAETWKVLERDLPAINREFPVHTSIVLLRSTLEGDTSALLDMARSARDSGCRSLRFYVYRPIGTRPKPEEIVHDDLPTYVAFRGRLDDALPGFCLWPAASRLPTEKRCPQLWQRISCDVSGAMGICCGTDKYLEGPHSNLFAGAPDDVFNHPTLVAMREQLLDPNQEPPDICKTCNLLGEPGW
ncbi:MAG: radical SAM protein [Myxococcales bacterium]